MQLLCKALALVGYEHHRCQYGQKSISLLEQNFIQHIQEYGLRFETKEEYEFRFQVYAKKDAEIDEINANQNQFQVGHNIFSTMTKSESFRGNKFKEPQTFNNKEPTYLDVKDLGQEFDWRSEGAINPVRDQGTSCQASWAITEASSIEAEYFLKMQKGLIQLSPQQIIDCATSYESKGCSGFLSNYAFSYAISHPLALESDYPYAGKTQSCSNNYTKGLVKIDDYIYVPSNRSYQLLAAIAEKPVVVNVQTTSVAFQHYKQGIFNSSICGTDADTQMLAVGYGTEPNLGGKYYILQNSWGTQWGEQGYMRIAATEFKQSPGICGVQSLAYYPVIF